VDDRICDCCDGSDERKSDHDDNESVECPNTCAEEGESMKRELRAHVSVMEQSILASRKQLEEYRFITDTCANREDNVAAMQTATKRLTKLKKKFVADEANIKAATEEYKKKNGTGVWFWF
jgi:hypothetical protein